MKRLWPVVVLLCVVSHLISCKPIQTSRLPDFQTHKVTMSENNLIARIQNSGAAVYDGALEIRLIIAASLTEGDSIDKTITVSQTWGPGERKSINLLSNVLPDNWPDALDYSQKTVAVITDPQSKIAEIDENNNLFETSLNVPCGAVITEVSPETIIFDSYGQGVTLRLEGIFGERQGTKNVVMQTHDGRVGHRFQNIQWHAQEMTVTAESTWFYPGRCYELFVECSSPESGSGYYTSNKKEVCIEFPEGSNGDNPYEQCVDAIPKEGWTYEGRPAGCWSEYLDRYAPARCDENGWYCCMLNADAPGSERCNPGYQEMVPVCCGAGEVTCSDEVLIQPYGCYERKD